METIKAICSGTCRSQTTHNVIKKHNVSGVSEYGISWWETYSIIQCAGCDEISFRKASLCTEELNPYTGELEEHVQQYPEPFGARAMMNGNEHFPAVILKAYREAITALNHGLPLLAAIGLRLVIETVCLDRKVSGKTLEEKINQLASQRHLTQEQAGFLHAHRFMGNIAAHEIESPKLEHLVVALDIAETLLKAIYVLPHLASEILPSKP